MRFRLQVHDEVSSTNDLVKRALEAGEPEGLAVSALVQTAGYGRQGRTWTSPAGGMYLSLLLRPNVALAQLPTLSLVAGMAVRRAIARFAAPELAPCVRIKWPNDVVLSCETDMPGEVSALSDGVEKASAYSRSAGTPDAESAVADLRSADALDAESTVAGLRSAGASDAGADAVVRSSFRKLSGISLEAHAGGICVGIGVNVEPPLDASAYAVGGKNTPAYVADLAASSPSDIASVRAAVLEEFSSLYDTWCDQGFSALAGDYAAHAALDGHVVSIENLDGSVMVTGAVQGVDEFGRLLVLPEGASDPAAVASGEAHVVLA